MTYADLIRSAITPEFEQLQPKSESDLANLLRDRIIDELATSGLAAGTTLERVRDWTMKFVKPACERAMTYGREVWDALQDEQTAHNFERLALVAGFFASHMNMQHWPLHELAALVLLTVSAVSKKGPEL